jgi:N-6 DNA Methylase
VATSVHPLAQLKHTLSREPTLPIKARLALAFIVLAFRCKNVGIEAWFGRHGAWSPDRIREGLVLVGCPHLLDGIDLPHPLDQESTALGAAAAQIATHLSGLTPASLAYLPSQLLQTLVPSILRKSNGEFYTPRWLVELTLERVAWQVGRERLIDPTCGSGAFLAGAALALRANPASLSDAAATLSGADLNPIAVLGARVACLAAVADLLEPGQSFEPDIRVDDLLQSEAPEPSDTLVGNPPWIRFSELTPDVQARVADAANHYDLVPSSSFHGGSELDVSAVFAYRMIDTHLKHGGRAALVMPSTLLRSASSARFRAFRLPNAVAFGLDHVTDFGAMRVFPGATNRTALLCWTKGHSSPVSVEAEVVETSKPPEEGACLTQARTRLQLRRSVARFVGTDQRIACFPLGAPPPNSLDGATQWIRGRKGVTTDLNGAYFVRVLGPGSAPNLVAVINDVTKRGKPVPVHPFEVEASLLFPLLKGAKQIRPFRVEPATLAVIVPNLRVSGMMDEPTFREKFPAAHQHFVWVEEQTGALSTRSTYRRMLAHSRAPFFNVYNVGDYTFSPIKVVWAEIARSLVAGIAGVSELFARWDPKVIVPDHKVYFASFEDLPPAQFLCALLNSTVVRSYVDAITEKLQVGALLDRVRLPAFDAQNDEHKHLVALAEEASNRFDHGMQKRIDRMAATVIGQ